MLSKKCVKEKVAIDGGLTQGVGFSGTWVPPWFWAPEQLLLTNGSTGCQQVTEQMILSHFYFSIFFLFSVIPDSWMN